MKLTKQTLQKLIKETYDDFNENDPYAPKPTRMEFEEFDDPKGHTADDPGLYQLNMLIQDIQDSPEPLDKESILGRLNEIYDKIYKDMEDLSWQ